MATFSKDFLVCFINIYNQTFFRKGNYNVWGPELEKELRKRGPAHQPMGFMDYYFNVDGRRGSNPKKLDVLDLAKAGMLDPIRNTDAIKPATDKFDKKMKEKVDEAIKKLQRPCYNGITATLTLRINGKREHNRSGSNVPNPIKESFVLGSIDNLDSSAKVILTRDRSGNITVSGGTRHWFGDEIRDASDFAHTNDYNYDELEGGTSYYVHGEWENNGSDFNRYNPGSAILRGSGYGDR